jgi:multidrug efflux pump subunit AcrA (membrane-fusion protein)
VAASPLMMIVPEDEPVLARIRISATDIDQVHVGQEASLKFTAFNGRQIPIILGTVRQVSADAFLDQLTQKSYYNVTVALEEAELAKLGHKDLLPGMPVEAFLATESRTPLNYLLRPIVFYFNRSFRDA